MKISVAKSVAGCLYLACFVLVCNNDVSAQSEPFQWTAENLEELNWKLESENEVRMLMEEQDETRSKPVNLNSASEEDLLRIPFLNSFQRKNLSDYLKEYGEVFSVFELLSVHGFDSALIRKITPFICFPAASKSPQLTFRNLAKYGKNDILICGSTVFPRSRGYRLANTGKESGNTNYYPGNPYGLSFRYTFTLGDRLAAGLSGDKDAGEQFFAGGQKNGMDYYSAYICYSGQRILKRLVVGNFRAGWGLGLTFNTGSSFGLYPGFNQEFYVGGGIRPTQSISGSGLLNGLALSIGAGRFTLSGICSFRKRDANVIDSDTASGRAISFSSFVETGYHRTEAEMVKKGRVSEFILGGNLGFRGNFFSLGLTAYSVSLGADFQPRPALYTHFAFTGKKNFVTGADFNLFYRFIRVSGEFSRSGNGSLAWISVLNFNPDPRFSGVLLYRDYPCGFQNLYSNCFRQNTNTANEKGWYISISASLPLHFNLSLFADFCSFPWAKYGVNTPSAGNEVGAMLTWPMNKSLSIVLRYMYSSGETNLVDDADVIRETGYKHLSDFRVQLNWNVSEAVSLQSRVEVKKSSKGIKPETTGWLMFQDISLKAFKIPLKIFFRYSVFDCPAYDSRICAYEPDVLYGYSMPAYYGRGIRVCTFLRYSAGRHLIFSLKAGLTRYNDKNSISSGLDQIDANWKLDLTSQLQIRI
ncbi:MAG: helix-hairpin-helix domain-containing protein [Bacteroidetes bacterium]|nr:helix-hairpin-helix domain-containing protein [Bacteroidota bacterium]